ncbi:MAG: putative membrane protein [Gammaproteobacteria bacterium]|nr:putative membrane protein [Gammaproteobacteria bacterium]
MADASPQRVSTPFQRRLLAEAWRRIEESGGSPVDATHAELAAVAQGGDFETRVLNRAQGLARSADLPRALHGLQQAARRAAWTLVVAGVLIGAAAARSTLNPDHAGLVNFYWVLVALLGIHTLAMLLWLVSLPFSFSGSHPLPTPLRAPFEALARMLAAAVSGNMQRTAQSAWMAVTGSGALGRWGLSALLHAFWLAALGGMLAVTLLMLSARQFDFVWETTILPDEAFIRLTERLQDLPARLGLGSLDRETIVASRRAAERPPPPGARRGWSALLVGSLIAYGMVPRAALLVISLLMLRHSRGRYRLDLELPGYARLRPRLLPASRKIGIIDADPGAVDGKAGEPRAGRLPAARETAVLGIEIDPPGTGWPPALAAGAQDLGIAADRAILESALQRLKSLQDRPLSLLVVCSLAASPDRGIARVLRDCRAAHHGPIALLLTHRARTALRLGETACREREGDWRRIAIAAGFDAAHILVLDLDDAAELRDFLLAHDDQQGAGGRA